LPNSQILTALDVNSSQPDRGVMRGAQFPGRQITMGAANNCGGRRKVPIMSHHKYFLQYSTFASEKPRVRTWERQTCSLTRAPSNVVMPLQILTNIFLLVMQQYGLTYLFL